MRVCAVVILAIAAIGSQRAYADDDGYFCVGPDYLALESRSFDSDGVHRLYTYSLDDGIGPRRSVDLPDFQVHGMRCDQTSVTLSSWDEAYAVAVSPQPRLLGRVESENVPEFKSKHPAQQIKAAPSGPLPVRQKMDRIRYELRLLTTRESHAGNIESTIVAKIVALSKAGEFVTSRVIYATTSFETID